MGLHLTEVGVWRDIISAEEKAALKRRVGS
jgi:hypothetical protein